MFDFNHRQKHHALYALRQTRTAAGLALGTTETAGERPNLGRQAERAHPYPTRGSYVEEGFADRYLKARFRSSVSTSLATNRLQCNGSPGGSAGRTSSYPPIAMTRKTRCEAWYRSEIERVGVIASSAAVSMAGRKQRLSAPARLQPSGHLMRGRAGPMAI